MLEGMRSTESAAPMEPAGRKQCGRTEAVLGGMEPMERGIEWGTGRCPAEAVLVVCCCLIGFPAEAVLAYGCVDETLGVDC